MSSRQSQTLADWLGEEPFHLAMSSGFYGFFAHAAVLAALEDADLRPASLSGSSAGGLAALSWASGMSAEEMLDAYEQIRWHVFVDPRPGLGVFRGAGFERAIAGSLKARSFDELEVPARVSVFEPRRRRLHVIDRGSLARAARATCSVPLALQPVRVDVGKAKRPLVIDGAFGDWDGTKGREPDRRCLSIPLLMNSPIAGGVESALSRQPDMVRMILPGLKRLGPFSVRHARALFDSVRRRATRALQAEPKAGRVRG